jgi:aspartyl-tRNA(Asn)/glutamyl-tRNA(Gln) amidotransferase subunit B
MRSKESAHDYRYFPDPDLLPLVIPESWIDEIRAELPELPAARKNRFVSEHGLQPYDADLLTSRKDVADYFESAVKTHSNAKALSNWIVGDLFRVLKERKLDDQLYIEYWPIPARHLAELVHLIDQDTISGKIAKTVFEAMLDGNKSPQQIVDEKDLKQDSDQGSIEKAIEKVLTANTAQVTQYKSGNTKVLSFLVGQTMKETQGKANPQKVNEILKILIEEKKTEG